MGLSLTINWTWAPEGATGPMKVLELRLCWRGWRRWPWRFRYSDWGAL